MEVCPLTNKAANLWSFPHRSLLSPASCLCGECPALHSLVHTAQTSLHQQVTATGQRHFFAPSCYHWLYTLVSIKTLLTQHIAKIQPQWEKVKHGLKYKHSSRSSTLGKHMSKLSDLGINLKAAQAAPQCLSSLPLRSTNSLQ